MKKIVSLFLFISVVLSSSVTGFAQETNALTEVQTLQDIYDSAYLNGLEESVDVVIKDDYSAYAFILKHNDAVIFQNNQMLLSDVQLSNNELNILNDFISRINVLIIKEAIEIDEELRIFVKDAPTATDTPITIASTFDVMTKARNHAAELAEVFDNAIFGTAHIVSGVYFTERVKSGGVWDYKSVIGTNTIYYEPTLRVNMTGETIGNFHYGYVGRAVFEPVTLKFAAGLYQIVSGTSDFSYWDSYFDDPKDTQDIQWGINVYNNEH